MRHLEVVLQGRRFFKEEVGVFTRNILPTVSPRLPNVFVTILVAKPEIFVRTFYKEEEVGFTASPCLPNVLVLKKW